MTRTTTRLGTVVATDANGRDLAIGYEIRLLCAIDEIPSSTPGIIVCWQGDYLGVDFDLLLPRNGKTFGGILPNATGLWVLPQHVERVTETIPEGGEEEALLKLVEKNDSVAFIGGKLYRLEKQRINAAEILNSLFHRISEEIRAIRTAHKRELAKVKEEAAKTLAFPKDFTAEWVKKGLSVCFQDGLLIVFIPFEYAPKYFCRDRDIPESALPPDICELLHTKDLLLHVYLYPTDGGGRYISLTKLTHKDFTPFSHYHGGGEECTGTLTPPTDTSIKNIYAYAKQYEKTLEAINVGHKRTSLPNGYWPTWEELKLKAVPLEKPVGFSVNYNKIPFPFSVGGRAKILRRNDDCPIDWIGKTFIVKDVHKSDFWVRLMIEPYSGGTWCFQGRNLADLLTYLEPVVINPEPVVTIDEVTAPMVRTIRAMPVTPFTTTTTEEL